MTSKGRSKWSIVAHLLLVKDRTKDILGLSSAPAFLVLAESVNSTFFALRDGFLATLAAVQHFVFHFELFEKLLAFSTNSAWFLCIRRARLTGTRASSSRQSFSRRSSLAATGTSGMIRMT